MSSAWRTAAAMFAVIFASCATNPVTGEREFSLMSEQQEIAVGQQADADIRREMGLHDDRELQEYVSTVGLRLAQSSERPSLPWHVGVVRADQFLHRSLRFALELPRNWDVMNGPTQVVAKQPSADVFLLLRLVERPTGRNIEQMAEAILQNRIDLYTAREGDTWQSIAERQGRGVIKATRSPS